VETIEKVLSVFSILFVSSFTMRRIDVLPFEEININQPPFYESNPEVNIWRNEEGDPNVMPKVNQMFHFLLILFPRCSCSPFVKPPGSSSTRTECEILFLYFIVSFPVIESPLGVE